MLKSFLIFFGVVFMAKSDGDSKFRLSQQFHLVSDIYYSCIMIARHYLNFGEGVIDQLTRISNDYRDIEDEDERDRQELLVWKRIYIDTIELCSEKQNREQAQQILQELSATTLNPRNYFDLFSNVNLRIYRKKRANLNFTRFEEELWKKIQDFEQMLKEVKDEADDDDFREIYASMDEITSDSDEDQHVEIFGIPVKFDSKAASILFLLCFFGLVSLIIYKSMNILSSDENQKKKKK